MFNTIFRFLFLSKSKILSISIVSVCISCLILLFSIAETVKKEILNDIENMGAGITSFAPYIYDKDKYYKTLSDEDLLLIKRRCRGIKKIAITSHCPLYKQLIKVEGEENYRHSWALKEKYVWFSQFRHPPIASLIIGTTPDYRKIMGLRLIKGRFINNTDVKLKRKVCVLPYRAYSMLGKGIIGKKIEIDDFPQESFTVVGALAESKPFWCTSPGNPDGSQRDILQWWFMSDDTVFIPSPLLPDIAKPFYPVTDDPEDKDFPKIVYIQIQTDPKKELTNTVKDVVKEIDGFIKKQYGENKRLGWPPQVAERLVDEWEIQTKQANTFIATIGGISLLASIIGILSIMLLSVTNRTSEIGVRRAFGARKKDIFFQFIIEALTITGIGGVFGIIFGIMGSYLIGWYASWEMVIPWYSTILALGCVFIIAIIGGTYPAYRASCISPAVAVKYE